MDRTFKRFDLSSGSLFKRRKREKAKSFMNVSKKRYICDECAWGRRRRLSALDKVEQLWRPMTRGPERRMVAVEVVVMMSKRCVHHLGWLMQCIAWLPLLKSAFSIQFSAVVTWLAGNVLTFVSSLILRHARPARLVVPGDVLVYVNCTGLPAKWWLDADKKANCG